MAGVINEPDLAQLQAYKDAAKLVNTSISPASGPFGGVLTTNPDAAAVSGTGTGTASSPTSGLMSAAISRYKWTNNYHSIIFSMAVGMYVVV